MRKILISGYLGYGNFGDEALLHVLIKDLTETGFKKQNITVISATPEYTSQLFNTNAANRWNFFEILGAIIDHDVTVFLGGLFQDRTSFKSFLYYYFQLITSLLLKKEVIFYGSGFGPFTSKTSKDLLSDALKTVNLITVRDETSANAVGLSLPVTCDPVWSIEPDYSFQNELIKVNWKLPILGVALRNDRALRRHHIDALAERLSRIIASTQDWQMVLIPCMHEDMPVLAELEKAITKRAHHPGRLLFITNFSGFSIPQQAGILSSCDVMVGMRYHSLLVPLASGKPVFGLIYDQKVKSLLDFSEQVGISFKDDMEKPWNYFWQNLERSTALAKIAQEKAFHLHKRNIELLEILAQKN
jgi:polysaccharide pyruvyl transferase CsaB